MKKYFFVSMSLLLLCNACNLLQLGNSQPKPQRQKITKVAPPPVDRAMHFSKFYKFKTGQSYTRIVQRSYYGMQADMQNEMNKYDIKKGFNIEEYNKYSKASFFQTDVYEIPADVKTMATELYKPLLDSIFILAAEKKSFHTEILVFGYTDEGAVPYNTPIYNELFAKSQNKYFNNTTYYNTLSFYRAKEVGDILSKLLEEKKSSFENFEKVSIDIYIEGKGIEYPDAKREYGQEDDKRKITKVYWKIFQ